MQARGIVVGLLALLGVGSSWIIGWGSSQTIHHSEVALGPDNSKIDNASRDCFRGHKQKACPQKQSCIVNVAITRPLVQF